MRCMGALQFLFAGCLGLFETISSQFTLEICTAAANCQKTLKPLYFKGSRSFKVIDVDTPKKLVTIACH